MRGRPPARLRWFDSAAGRVTFVHPLHGLERVRLVRRGPFTGGFSFEVRLQLVGLPPRRVLVAFRRESPEEPRVFVDGPKQSPHRYNDGSLCMWHPRDPLSQRWCHADGAADLVTAVAAHLLQEEWWRRTGEWVGAEAPHGPLTAEEAAA